MKQPDWVFKRWEKYNNKTTLEIVSEFWEKNRILPFKNALYSKLRGGYLLGDWIKRAKNFALIDSSTNKQKNLFNPKMILYSAVKIYY